MDDNHDNDKVGSFDQQSQSVAGKQTNVGPVEGGIGHLGDVIQVAAPAEKTISLEAALARLADLPTAVVPEAGNLPPNSRMPYGLNPKFTGRVADFKALAEAVKAR